MRMRNCIFIILTVLILFFLKPINVEASGCGDPNAASPGNKCCDVNIDNINTGNISTEEDTGADDWGCITFIQMPITGWKLRWCVSAIFNSGKQSIKNVLNTDNALDALKAIGVCNYGSIPNKLDPSDKDCVCSFVKPTGVLSSRLCNSYIIGNKPSETAKKLIKDKEYTGCVDCFRGGGFWTGLGCFYMADSKAFIEKNVFGIGLGIAGMIALLCIIYSAFTYQTSQGNPEKIKSAQERLTSCILGLLLIVFSIFILRLIGVSIFGLPGLK